MSQTQRAPRALSLLPDIGDRTADPVATLVYRSRAVAPLSASELHHLTASAQSRNSRESITGVMVYDDSRFFQWLEGPSESLVRVMQSIRNDPRHTDIEILNDETARQRAFGSWSMKLATRGATASIWGDDVLEPPTDIVDHLRLRPHAAPSVLIQLVPLADAADPAADEAIKAVPLARTTAAILKGVILAAVIPSLAGQHGVTAPGARAIPINPRVAELADLLVATDPTAARELIDELHHVEGSIWPLYGTLFEPAARSLGNLWAEDHCSEFDVTMGLSRIQTAARLLGAHTQPKLAVPSHAAAVLIAPEPGETHRLGAALDSEVLWNAGWAPRCEYPADDRTLQDLVSKTWFDVLDISLSTAFRREHWLPRLTKTIAAARSASRNPVLLVVVGGRIFAEQESSGAQIGADVTSVTAAHVDELISRGMARRDLDGGGGEQT
jgi:methanogenic corrinoid protein MtbC1